MALMCQARAATEKRMPTRPSEKSADRLIVTREDTNAITSEGNMQRRRGWKDMIKKSQNRDLV